MFRVLITGALHPIALENFNKENDIQIDYKPDFPYQKIIEIIGLYDCILTRSETNIDHNLIEHGKKLTVIARAAVGIGNIDVAYATQKGILVFNTPGKNTNSAAELTLLLILSVLRKLPQAHMSMSKDQWNRHEFTGQELLNKTVGIIGVGNVGHRVARFLSSFETKLLAYDPYVTAAYCQKHNCTQVGINDLLEKSDIITLHVPKNQETIDMIGKNEIEKMKDGVFIINAARGGVINESALEAALKSGKVSGSGIDTWNVEPVMEHPLKKFHGISMTPHIGASTKEAQYRIGKSVSMETIKALRGGIVSNPVNLPKMSSLEGPYVQKYNVLAQRLGSLSRQFIAKDFSPETFDFVYRGKLEKDDWALIKLSYMKGFLKNTVNVEVSYVNALQIAKSKGYKLVEKSDKSFTDYETAIRIKINGLTQSFIVGGTVFGREQFRLSYLNHFVFEVEPIGNILIVENQDSPGVIGHIGNVLSENKININQFELSRQKKGGSAMAVVLVDEEIPETVMFHLENHTLVNKVHKIFV